MTARTIYHRQQDKAFLNLVDVIDRTKQPESTIIDICDMLRIQIDKAHDMRSGVINGSCHLKISHVRALLDYVESTVGNTHGCSTETTTTPTLSPSDKPNITAVDADGVEWVTCAQKAKSLGLAYSTVAGYKNRWQTTINNPFSTHADAYLIRADEPKPQGRNRK